MGFIDFSTPGMRSLRVEPPVDLSFEFKRIRELFPAGCWAGKSVFLIGGGPSLRNVDLAEVCSMGWPVVAVNKSAPEIRATARFTIDDRFADWWTKDVNWEVNQHRAPLLYVGNPWRTGKRWERIWQEDSLEHMGAIREHPWPVTYEVGGLRAVSNSGAAAVNFLDVCGAETVYLLGFDCNRGIREDGKCDWHHDGYKKAGFGRQPDQVYDRFIDNFRNVVKLHVRARVVNCNPDSAVDCFEFGHWRD